MEKVCTTVQDSDNTHAVRVRGASAYFHPALATAATADVLHVLWLGDTFRNGDCSFVVPWPGLHLWRDRESIRV